MRRARDSSFAEPKLHLVAEQPGLQRREAVMLGAIVLLAGILLGQRGSQGAGPSHAGLWTLLQRAALGLAVANGAAALVLQGCRLWQDTRLYSLI